MTECTGREDIYKACPKLRDRRRLSLGRRAIDITRDATLAADCEFSSKSIR